MNAGILAIDETRSRTPNLRQQCASVEREILLARLEESVSQRRIGPLFGYVNVQLKFRRNFNNLRYFLHPDL